MFSSEFCKISKNTLFLQISCGCFWPYLKKSQNSRKEPSWCEEFLQQLFLDNFASFLNFQSSSFIDYLQTAANRPDFLFVHTFIVSLFRVTSLNQFIQFGIFFCNTFTSVCFRNLYKKVSIKNNSIWLYVLLIRFI